MKEIFLSLVVTVYLLTLIGCKSKEQASELSETDSIPLAEELVVGGRDTIPLKNVIRYSGAVQNNIRTSLETFSPLTSVLELAQRSISLKDSLEFAHETKPLTDPQDSLIFMPHETRAYQAILDYKKLMASGPSLQDACPKLIELNRVTDAGDSSSNLLPSAGVSTVLSHGDFFFLGGAPFISKLTTDDNAVYSDPQGNPETRFESYVSENGNYLVNSLYHFKKNLPTTISFGPPLGSYDAGPQEVNGVGSLIHEFNSRIPVVFFTENGLVPAHLISITIKIVPESLGCISDQPNLVFACSKNIEAQDILGIYIPYNTTPIASCKITRHPNFVWTADLNNDGIPEFACVTGSFEGIASDVMLDVLWFVNIEGGWEIIDSGQELDCT
jgi:hypothetical protein